VPKVDMRKVNLNVIKPWIAKKIVELVGIEDDILIGYALELLDDPVGSCFFSWETVAHEFLVS
jgi:hypothetical protein